jgi:uncharacterized protein (DUF1501 family)
MSAIAAIEAIFLRDEFWAPERRHGMVKPPIPWLVELQRRTGARLSESSLDQRCDTMGHQLFLSPSVAGWGHNNAWLSGMSLLGRARVAADMSRSSEETGFFAGLGDMAPDEAVDRILEGFGVPDASAGTRDVLNTWYIDAALRDDLSDSWLEREAFRVRAMLPEVNLACDSGVYNDQRLSLAVSPSGSTSAGNGLWFHPSLTYLRQRYLQGDVAVFPAVGEPTNDRSHFSSTSTWMTGRELGTNRSTGWMGRWLDAQPDDVYGASVDGGRAVQIRGEQSKVVAVSRSSSDLLPGSSQYNRGNASMWRHNHGGLSPVGNEFGAVLRNAAEFSSRLSPLYASGVNRDSDRFVADLQRAADVLNLGLGVRAVSATLNGFDTHSAQEDRHDDLLATLDRALFGFFTGLLPALHGQTTVLVISEFGRRVRRNSSLGTDHGSGGIAFVIGDRVKGGLKTAYPSLTDLTGRGDLKYETDFRSIYTTIAQDWLADDGVRLLGTSHPEVDLFVGGPQGIGVAGFLDDLRTEPQHDPSRVRDSDVAGGRVTVGRGREPIRRRSVGFVL